MFINKKNNKISLLVPKPSLPALLDFPELVYCMENKEIAMGWHFFFLLYAFYFHDLHVSEIISPQRPQLTNFLVTLLVGIRMLLHKSLKYICGNVYKDLIICNLRKFIQNWVEPFRPVHLNWFLKNQVRIIKLEKSSTTLTSTT